MLLQERTASATLEDDEEEVEDDEVDGDDRATARPASCPDAPTSSCASRASSCSRSDASPTRNASSATTAPDPRRRRAARRDRARRRASLAGLCFTAVSPRRRSIVVPLARARCWAWRGAATVPSRRWCGLAFGVGVLRRRHRRGSATSGSPRIVGVIAIMAFVVALTGLVVGLLRGARRRVAAPHRGGVGGRSRRSWAACPFGGFPWADLGVALHDVPAARALASVGGVAARHAS